MLRFALAVFLTAAPAEAGVDPAAAERALAVAAAALPDTAALPAPPDTVAAAPVMATAPKPPTPFIAPALWESLTAPAPELLAALAARAPGLDPASVRELSWEAADALLARAAEAGLSSLELFTDEGLSGAAVYYAGPQTLERLFSKYRLGTVNRAVGKDKKGKPYRMDALLLGGGRALMLYDREEFSFENPEYPEYSYWIKGGGVRNRIQAYGDLRVEGLGLHAWPVNPRIERYLKTAEGKMLLETNHGSRERPLVPIRLWTTEELARQAQETIAAIEP